jgi:hypothetical protein
MPGFFFSRLVSWCRRCAFSHSSLQHVLIRYSARSGAHYLNVIEQETHWQTAGKNRFRWASTMTQGLKETDMKKLSIVFLLGIATLVTVTEPLLAAQRKHRASDAYARGAVTEQVGPQYSGRIRDEALTPAQHVYSARPGGQNLPYADRPYGAPDGW